ncbi:protein kinase [bacterium]|nr:protein kinase [bacterium]
MVNLGDIIGPYCLRDEIGRGGMGVVFRAEHLTSGEQVALKTVVVQNQEHVQSIRREIHTLAKIDHPGVVRILDEGLYQSVPWYAMELLEGKTLRSYIESTLVRETKSPTDVTIRVADLQKMLNTKTVPDGHLGRDLLKSVRVFPDQASSVVRPYEMDHEKMVLVFSIITRICLTLSYLHGEGIIHQDLKPGNIFIRPDGMPVLVDFGLMSQCGGRTSREVLSLVHTQCGTVNYMAPEQIRGEYVDARADLYALGCIFYEVLIGRPPFFGENVYQIINDHICKVPEPPSSIITNLPEQIDALIMRLLEKNALRRQGYAVDVARILMTAGATLVEEVSHLSARPYLYRARFTGRESIMNELSRRLDDLESDHGCLVIIEGDSGTGKTRLLMELALVVTERGQLFLSTECMQKRRRPLEAFRKPLQAIADFCREQGVKQTRQIMGVRTGVLGLYEPALLDLPGIESVPPLEELGPEAALLRLYTYLFETLLAFSDNKPLILLIDDLQWVDELTMGFLDFLFRQEQLHDTGLMVIGTCLSGEETSELKTLMETRLLNHYTLDRLPDSAVSRMIADMLALESPPNLFTQMLTRHGEGNPFFISEYLRTTVEEQYLQRDRAGIWHLADHDVYLDSGKKFFGLAIPATLRDLVQQRFRSLSAQALTMIEAAAVIGRESSYRLLHQMVNLDETDFLEAIDELIRKKIFVESESGALRFGQNLFREMTYDQLTNEQRIMLHAQAAQAIELLFAEHADDYSDELAHHHEQAGQIKQALHWNRKAAEHSKFMFANKKALSYLDKALELLPLDDHLQRVELLFLREGVLDIVGDRASQHRDLVELQQLSERLQDIVITGRLYLRQARLLERQGAYFDAIQKAEQAIRQGRLAQQIRHEAEAYLLLGTAHLQLGDLETAQRKFEQTLAMAHVAKLRTLEIDCLNELSALAIHQDDQVKSLAFAEQALEICQDYSYQTGMARAHWNLGRVYDQLHADHRRSLESMETARRIFRETGNLPEEAQTVLSMGTLFFTMRVLPEALNCFEHALRINRQTGDFKAQAAAITQHGLMTLFLGDRGMARLLFQQAHDLYLKSGSVVDIAEVCSFLGLVCYLEHDLDCAADYCARAVSAASSTSLDKLLGTTTMINGRILLGMQRIDEAEQAYNKALKIRNPLKSMAEIIETKIALARVLVYKNEPNQALKTLEPLLEFISLLNFKDLFQPLLALHDCHCIFKACFDDRTEMIAATANVLVQTEAEKIPDPRLKQTYLSKNQLHSWFH